MASQMIMKRRAAQCMAALAAGGVGFYPQVVHAETPSFHSKKPIYDESETIVPVRNTAPRAPSVSHPATINPKPEPVSPSPSPVDRLAGQVRIGRLFLYRQACQAEDAVNAAMAKAFSLEHAFTSTVASLAPAAETGEKLLPGLVYVAVAGMAGGIVTSKRNVVLRAAGPLAFGLGAAWLLIPFTMGNIRDFMWEYERSFPAVADAHARARQGIEHGWNTATVHATMAQRRVTESIGEARQTVEEWIAKGR